MSRQYSDSCLIQFARAPLLGQVKTRLEPALGKERCLALHQALVAHQFRTQLSAAVCDVELWCSHEHSFFHQLVGATGIPIRQQQGSDLGEKMGYAMTDGLSRYAYVVIIGSDCPAMDGRYISQALALLHQGVPAVFGPATDGGYVLIGLSRFDPVIFEGISWGTDRVMAQTRQQLQQLNWPWRELGFLADIDHPCDLKHLSGITELQVF